MLKTIEILCNCKKVELMDNSRENALDFCVFFGNITIFSTLLLKIFDRYK